MFVNHERDVRLLLLEEAPWSDLRPARWGTVNGAADMTGQVWGYPWASVRGSDGTGHAAEATIKGAPTGADHRQVVTDLDPRPDGGAQRHASGWMGISGGPVTAGDCLVGMLQTVDGSYDALRMVTSVAMLDATDGESGETLREVIWRHINSEVVASNQGLLVPSPVRPIGPNGTGYAAVLEPPVLPPLHTPLRPLAALQYRHAVVPYMPGDPIGIDTEGTDASIPETKTAGATAEGRLTEFLDEGAPFRATVLTGSGGIGKSRAAQELMVRAAAVGWMVGLLKAGTKSSWSDLGHKPDSNLLVVVDYPEELPGSVGKWLEWATSAVGDGSFRVRAVLLSRRRGAFGRALLEETELDDEDLETLGRKGLGQVGPLWDRAVRRFSQLKPPLETAAAPDVSEFSTTLGVLGAALVGGTSDTGVIDKLLQREVRFWRFNLLPEASPRSRVTAEIVTEIEGGMGTAVAAISLGGVSSQDAATARLACFGFSSDASKHVAAKFEGMYGVGYAPLHPDPVADALIVEQSAELVVGAIAATPWDSRAEAWSVLARVVGSVRPESGEERSAWVEGVHDALDKDLDGVAAEIVDHAQKSHDRGTLLTMVTALSELVSVLPWGDLAVLLRFERALEANTDAIKAPLHHLAAAIDQVEAIHWRAQAAENRAYEPDLAAALNNLAIRLAETGDRAGAVAPAQEAVDLRRAQAAENRAYEPNLAAALNNLAISLSETGDRAGAVAPAKEAVTIYERLVENEPFRSGEREWAKRTLDGVLNKER